MAASSATSTTESQRFFSEPGFLSHFGGFSSGGVVSLLISDYIIGMKQFYIDPKGLFIVDSPIDLAALYTSSEKNIKRSFSEVSVQESNWIIKNST